jgi:CheY-like chemotaxis protein
MGSSVLGPKWLVFLLFGMSDSKRQSYRPEPQGNASTTALLVDSDLGFIFWLGQALDLAGYSALPAKNTQAADELIQEHKPSIDVLVIDPLLPNALPFASCLRQSRRDLKVIAVIPEGSEESFPVAEVDVIKHRPRHFSRAAALQWVNLIQTLASAPRSALG